MSNNKAHFIINQSTDFIATLTWYTDSAKTVVKDLTGFTGAMKIKKNLTATEIIELTTANSRITIAAPTTGVIVLSIDAADTATLVPDTYIYDLLMIKTGETQRLIQGTVAVDEAVT